MLVNNYNSSIICLTIFRSVCNPNNLSPNNCNRIFQHSTPTSSNQNSLPDLIYSSINCEKTQLNEHSLFSESTPLNDGFINDINASSIGNENSINIHLFNSRLESNTGFVLQSLNTSKTNLPIKQSCERCRLNCLEFITE